VRQRPLCGAGLVRLQHSMGPSPACAAVALALICCFTACPRAEDIKAKGIITQHAYSVLSVRTTPRGTRLIRMRNPWASGTAARDGSATSWTGRWSDKSAEWDGEGAGVKEDFQAFVQTDTGIFWMVRTVAAVRAVYFTLRCARAHLDRDVVVVALLQSIEDFAAYFTRVDVARTHKSSAGWQTVRVSVPVLRSGDKQAPGERAPLHPFCATARFLPPTDSAWPRFVHDALAPRCVQ